MKKIDFVKREYKEEGREYSERFWDLIEEAAGGKEAEDKYSAITDKFIAAVTPASLRGVEYPELPDEIHNIVSEFEELMGDYDTLTKKQGFNAGYEAGLAAGVLLGMYGNKVG